MRPPMCLEEAVAMTEGIGGNGYALLMCASCTKCKKVALQDLQQFFRLN